MATERPPGREVCASGTRATPGNGDAVPRPLSDVSSLTVRRLDGPERLPSQRGRRQRTHDGDRLGPLRSLGDGEEGGKEPGPPP